MIRLTPLVLLCLVACKAQGKATRVQAQEAREGMQSLRAGTEYDQALRMLEVGDLDLALQTIETCIERAPDVEKSYLVRARILIERGDLREALAALDVIPESRNHEFPYLRGFVFEQRGELEKALLEYERALEWAPNRPEIMLAMAEVLVPLGRVDEARVLLDQESGDHASNPGFRQALGHLALLEGDAEQAEGLFVEAALLSPRDDAILEDLLRIQVALGKYAAALRTFEGIDGVGRRRGLGRLHAHCLLKLRQPVEARAVLLELTVHPDYAQDFEAWQMLADTALMLNDDRLLRTAADKMMQVGPKRPEGFMTIALWKRNSGDLEGALVSVGQAKERAQDDPTLAKLEALLLQDLARAGG